MYGAIGIENDPQTEAKCHRMTPTEVCLMRIRKFHRLQNNFYTYLF